MMQTSNMSSNNLLESNIVNISGKIVTEQEFSHEVYGEGFYKFTIESLRLSDASDHLPVTISERLFDRALLTKGVNVEIVGQLRSYNNYSEVKNKLILTIFAKEVKIIEESENKNNNNIYLNGYVCKKPVYRTTPFGREIADILIAVNRAYNKSDYIPLIAWGRNARFGGILETGENIKIWGRIQSRIYQKKIDEVNTIEKTALEVSVTKLEKCEDKNSDS